MAVRIVTVAFKVDLGRGPKLVYVGPLALLVVVVAFLPLVKL